MKLERLHEYFTIIVTICCAIFLALYLGMSAGNGTSTPFLVIGGIVTMAVTLIMRADIWLLIPLFWPLSGQLVGAPGSFPLHDVVIAYVFVAFLALKALKLVRTKAKYNWLDYLLWLNLFILVMAYIRNPVGTLSMGVDKIGGKAYFEVVFAVLAYWVFGHVTVSKNRAARFPILLVGGSILNLAIGLVSHKIPIVGSVLGRMYTGAYVKDDLDQSQAVLDMGREEYLGESSAILKILYCFYPPLTTINPVYLLRFCMTVVCVICIALSGFRSMLMDVAGFFLLSLYFRTGIGSVLRFVFVCFPLIILLVSAQGTLIDLPHNVQRTLSFLPGKWDHDVMEDANGSVEWRHEIWSNVWDKRNKYIVNWWFGDGFGITKRQLVEALANEREAQENLTIAGAYHSLPLTTIHVVGYVGLFFFCILIFGTAYYGWALILRAKGTPYFPTALFLGIPCIYSPLPSLILTGFYDLHIVGTIISVGLMRVISRSLDKYNEEKKSEISEPKKIFPTGRYDRFSETIGM